MKIAIMDIETTQLCGILLSEIETIFCIGIKINNESTKCFTFTPTNYSDGDLNQALELLNSCDLIVGHNICKFDIPIIENLLGKITKPICDTLIDAKLMLPKDKLLEADIKRGLPKALQGSYSLKAFGYRLGIAKLEFDDFSHLCEAMVTYCKRDVDLTYKLYKKLSSHKDYPKEQVRNCEYEVARIIQAQEEYGFYFDITKARNLATKLKFQADNLNRKLKSIFKPILVADGDIVTPKKPRRMKIKWDNPDGFIYKYFVGEYQKIKLENFNPNSRQQIAKRLIKMFDWKPQVFTEKGNIVVNEEVLKTKELN